MGEPRFTSIKTQEGPIYPYGAIDHAAGSGKYNLLRTPSAVMDLVYEKLGLLQPGALVANFGCGNGNQELNAPLSRAYKFVSFDRSNEAIAQLGEAMQVLEKGDTAIVGDLRDVKLVPESLDSAIFWRVLHAISPEHHVTILRTIFNGLKLGANLFIAVLSDEDWKKQALGQQYQPNEMNDCAEIMQQAGGTEVPSPWPLFFFSQEYLYSVASAVGFEISEVPISFNEPTGFEGLKATRPDVTYRFAVLRKPEEDSSERSLRRTTSTW